LIKIFQFGIAKQDKLSWSFIHSEDFYSTSSGKLLHSAPSHD